MQGVSVADLLRGQVHSALAWSSAGGRVKHHAIAWRITADSHCDDDFASVAAMIVIIALAITIVMLLRSCVATPNFDPSLHNERFST